jgi:AcrR family transcriptional regulator
VTLDDIAASAKLTKRTLYYHFATKDDLIVAYLRAWSDRTAQSFVDDDNADGVSTLLAVS